MKRFDILMDTSPPRSAYSDGDRIEKEEGEWVIYRKDQVIGRFRADRVLGITISEIQEQLELNR
jgi:hypothetical protein